MDQKELVTAEKLEAGLSHVCESPQDAGIVKLIVRRPQIGDREIVTAAELDLSQGLVGDNWLVRGSRHTPDGSALPDAQLTIMNSRAIDLISGAADRWPLAGDQLYVDMDLSQDNVPAGTRLAVGSGVVEVSGAPHTGCKSFAERFGKDATRFVNSPLGKQLRLRGLNARIVRGGMVRVGDVVKKLPVS